MKVKALLLKSFLVALSFSLFFTGITTTKVSASETDVVGTEDAIAILEALDRSSVIKEDGTIFFDEAELERNLSGSPEYDELKKELENEGLLNDGNTQSTTDTIYNLGVLNNDSTCDESLTTNEAVYNNSMTLKVSADTPMMMASTSAVNPKWTAARNACAKRYISNEYGVAALGTTITAMFSGNFRKAVLELAARGAKLSVPGLAAVYVHMNYTCIKEANSKHKVYN